MRDEPRFGALATRRSRLAGVPVEEKIWKEDLLFRKIFPHRRGNIALVEVHPGFEDLIAKPLPSEGYHVIGETVGGDPLSLPWTVFDRILAAQTTAFIFFVASAGAGIVSTDLGMMNQRGHDCIIRQTHKCCWDPVENRSESGSALNAALPHSHHKTIELQVVSAIGTLAKPCLGEESPVVRPECEF